jgi:hypothetical protein
MLLSVLRALCGFLNSVGESTAEDAEACAAWQHGLPFLRFEFVEALR